MRICPLVPCREKDGQTDMMKLILLTLPQTNTALNCALRLSSYGAVRYQTAVSALADAAVRVSQRPDVSALRTLTCRHLQRSSGVFTVR